MPVDTAKNTMAQARRLTLGPAATAINEWVGLSDPSDYFRFNLGSRSRLNLGLRAAGVGAWVQLVRDRNNNGRLDTGEVIRQRRSLNNQLISFLVDVPAGPYFLRIQRANGNANYRLIASARPVPTDTGLSPLLSQVLTLTNQYRQQNGLQPLTYNAQLGTAAQTHTRNMALQDFFSHTGLDGSQSWDRVTATGYTWSRVTENIGAGYRTAQEVVQGWMNSSGHRANILDPNVNQIGLGYYYLSSDTGVENWNYYWTQVFAKPR